MPGRPRTPNLRNDDPIRRDGECDICPYFFGTFVPTLSPKIPLQYRHRFAEPKDGQVKARRSINKLIFYPHTLCMLGD